MKEYFFRVKYGFNASDQVSIPESDVEKAIGARLKGVPVGLGGKYINGSNIIVIEPHYHRYTGWNDWYEPRNGEDWEQVKRDCPDDIDKRLEYYERRVKHLITSGRQREIGKNVEIPEIKMEQIEERGEVKQIGEAVEKLKAKYK